MAVEVDGKVVPLLVMRPPPLVIDKLEDPLNKNLGL